jgi:hypothetical protein
MKARLSLAVALLVAGSSACGGDGVTSADLNRDPSLTPVSDIAVLGGETESVTVSATDADGDQLTLELTPGPGASWAYLTGVSQSGNTTTATLVVSPDMYTVGSYSVTLEVTDEKGGSDSQVVDIAVGESPFLTIGGGVGDLDLVFSEVVVEHEGYQSLSYFGYYMTDVIHPGSPVASLMPEAPLGAVSRLTRPASTLVNVLGSLAAAPARLSAELVGTWEWDTGSNAYVRSSPSPTDRLRFVLYAVNPVTGVPILPLDPIGYFDIINLSSPSVITIQGVAVVSDVTVIDVTATGSLGVTLNLELDGYLSMLDGSQTLDFEIDLLVTESSADLDILATLGDYTLEYKLMGEQGTETVAARVTDGGDTIEIYMIFNYDQMTINGAVAVNGSIYVTFSGSLSGGTLSFFDAEGDPLSSTKANFIEALFLCFAGFEGFFFELIDFAMSLCGFY